MEKQHATHHKEIPLMEAIIEPLMATIKYILFGSETKKLSWEAVQQYLENKRYWKI